MHEIYRKGQTTLTFGHRTKHATVVIPPFRARIQKIPFFHELAEAIARTQTTYLLDYSFMTRGRTQEYTDATPEKEIEEVAEVYEVLSNRHVGLSVIASCHGLIGALGGTNKERVSRLLTLSPVDLENFADFLRLKVARQEGVSILPSSNETLTITPQRIDWYKGKTTKDWLKNIDVPHLCLGYENDPYIYQRTMKIIKGLPEQSPKTEVRLYPGKGHRLAGVPQVIDDVVRFLCEEQQSY